MLEAVTCLIGLLFLLTAGMAFRRIRELEALNTALVERLMARSLTEYKVATGVKRDEAKKPNPTVLEGSDRALPGVTAMVRGLDG